MLTNCVLALIMSLMSPPECSNWLPEIVKNCPYTDQVRVPDEYIAKCYYGQTGTIIEYKHKSLGHFFMHRGNSDKTFSIIEEDQVRFSKSKKSIVYKMNVYKYLCIERITRFHD